MSLKLDENPSLKPTVGAIFKSKPQILNTVTNLDWKPSDVSVDNVPYSEEKKIQDLAKVISKSEKGDITNFLYGKCKNVINKGSISPCEHRRFSMIDESEPAATNEDFYKNIGNNYRKGLVSTVASEALFKFCKTNLLGVPENETCDNLPADCSCQITMIQTNNIEEGNSFTENKTIVEGQEGNNIFKEKQILPLVPNISTRKSKLVLENEEDKKNTEKINLTEICGSTCNKSPGFASNRRAHSENSVKTNKFERPEDATLFLDKKELEDLPTAEKEWNIDSLVFYEDLFPQKPRKKLFHFPKARETFQNIKSQAVRSFRSLASELSTTNKISSDKDKVVNQQNCDQAQLDQAVENEEATKEISEAMEGLEPVNSTNNLMRNPPKHKPCRSNTHSKHIPSPNWDDLHFLGESMPAKKDKSSTIMDFGRNARTSVRHWYATKKKADIN